MNLKIAPLGYPFMLEELASSKKLAAMKMNFREDVADVIVRSLGPTEVMFEAVCEYINASGNPYRSPPENTDSFGVHDFTNHGFQVASLAPLVSRSASAMCRDDLRA
jgi:hypothetical protein